MREIKFNYIFKDQEGKFHRLTETIEQIEGCIDVSWNIHNGWELIARREYTGLKDKNGKEIYEGDILGNIWAECYIAWCDKCKSLQIFMGFGEGCEACSGDAHWRDLVEDDGKLEVIGDIYQNPELLTKEG